MFQAGELSLDELVEAHEAVQREIYTRANSELQALDARRMELLRFLGKAPAAPIIPNPPIRIPYAAKFRDPETGKTWSGKGKHPKWFNPERRDEFLIDSKKQDDFLSDPEKQDDFLSDPEKQDDSLPQESFMDDAVAL